MTKTDTPIKPPCKTTAGRSTSKPVSNEDLMATLHTFKAEILSSTNTLSDLQASQFNDLKLDLSQVSTQLAEMKAENTRLQNEIEVLKSKVSSLEMSGSIEQPQLVVTQVLQETFERERCLYNLIGYGVPESTSMAVPQRISHDRQTICSILESLGDVIPQSSKLIRLGKLRNDNTARPLKIIFDNKESATRLLLQFNTAKRSGTSFLNGFRLASDKTALQRKLLRSCHDELDRRTQGGESGLRIMFDNGLPKVGVMKSKNGNGNHLINQS